MTTEPLTLPMCSPIGDGAAALIVTGAPNGAAAPIRIRASALSATGGPAPGSVVQRASVTAREQSGLGAADVDVIEVHDATASAEIEAYEHLGLAAPGEGNRLIVGQDRAGRRAAGQHRRQSALARAPSRRDGCAADRRAGRAAAGPRGGAPSRSRSPAGAPQNAGGFVEGDNAVAVITVLERER